MFFHASGKTADFVIDLPADDNVTVGVGVSETVAAFYRRHFGSCRQSWGRIYVGATEERGSAIDAFPNIDDADRGSSLIFGADMHVSLSECWALETGFTWLSGLLRMNWL